MSTENNSKNNDKKVVTIIDIAQAAGVSQATVSRVINQSGLVAEPTAKLVRETIERMGYVPNQQARNLRHSESGTVVVLLPNITNPFYASVFSGINEEMQRLGYQLYLCDTEGRNQEELLDQVIRRKQADGAILLQIGSEETWLQKYSRSFPVVQCCEYAEHCDAPYVTVSNEAAAYQAVSFLIQQGHRRIGIISSTNDFMSTRHRTEGYRRALLDGGLEYDAALTVYCDDSYSYPSSLKAAEQILSRKNRPDALFCFGDSVALAAVVAAKEMMIRVPEELSIVGFDDVIYTQMLHPYLTTVAQPCYELGQKASNILHRLMTTGDTPERCAVLPHSFIVRESTCSVERMQNSGYKEETENKNPEG